MKRYVSIVFHPSFFLILALLSIILSLLASLLHWEIDADFFAQKSFILFGIAILIHVIQVTGEVYPRFAKKITRVHQYITKVFLRTLQKLYE